MDKRHKKLQMKYREVCRSLQQGRERENSMACEFEESREKLEAADKAITELQTLLSDIIAKHHTQTSILLRPKMKT